MKHTSENYRNYIMSIVVLFGMLSLYYFFFVVSTKGSQSAGVRMIGLMSFHLLAGCVFTSSIFSGFSNKRRAIASMSLPASHFEKFLVGWLYSFLIFSAVYILVFTVVDYAFLPFMDSADNQSLFKIFPGQGFPFAVFWYYAFLHGVMIYGAIRFQDASFIKTATLLIVVLIILCFSHSWFLDFLISEGKLAFTLPMMNDLTIIADGAPVYYRINLDKSKKATHILFLVIGVAFAMWAAAFYCLKEKEV